MTLKEKLDIIKGYDEQDPHETFMTIADNYAIEFAEWLINIKSFDSYHQETPSKELLEIFKKEKELLNRAL